MANSIDDAVKAFVKMRDDLAAKRKEYKEFEATRKEQMEVISDHIKAECHKQGVDSFKTKHGTAFITHKTSASVLNWDNVINYIKKSDDWQLLNRSVNKTAVQEYIKENNSPPPGVGFDRIEDLQIRRPPK